MKKDKVKSFKEWYDDEEQEFSGKPKHREYKRTQMRKENALKRGDISGYLDEDDESTW